ncbi:MAG TPA: hypothetical protein VL972_06785 [Solirubrobacteraceae bacterium]|nr:hypothetical protein [Solirubrobacteraceae bacterium]
MLKPGIVATLVACALALGLAPLAQAEETLSITEAGFSPDLTGVPANAFGRGIIGSTTGPVPSPITHVNVYGPAGTTLNLEGTGVCSAEKLKNMGPEACPADSKAGFGGGEGTYEIGGEIVNEPYTLDFFLADNKPGHISVLIFLKGSTPVSIELVFTATVVTGPAPYGLGFSLNVPLIKVLPEASDASAKTAYITLGAKNVAYYKKIHGKRVLEHVKGIITPKTCKGSWPVETQITFEDGSTVTAKRSVPCRKSK